jgi:hypothetical protein
MTSEDVDFFGDRQAAERFAARLEAAKVYIPGPDDYTPHAAVIVGTVGDRRIKVDFLHSILGVDRASIENNFITLSGTHKKTGAPIDILVLHPLDCLRSRISNINDLRRKDPHSISSAQASIIVLQAFVDDLLSQGLIKEAQGVLHDLYFVTRGCLGTPAHKEFGVDPREILRPFLDDGRLDDRWRAFNLTSALRRLDEKATRVAEIAFSSHA